MKRIFALLAAAALIAAAIPSPASALLSDVKALHQGEGVARSDCGRSVFWFCGRFPSRPVAINLCTQPAKPGRIGWCVTVHYREISFLSAIRTCKTFTRWDIVRGTLLVHVKTCGSRSF